MKSIRITGEHKYHKDRIEFNEEFGNILDFAINMILKHKIKTIHFGSDYQYLKYGGNVKTFMTKRKKYNNKSLMIKSKNFEIECNPYYYWDGVEIKPKEIAIKDVGLYFIFEKSIWPEYKKVKKMMERKNGKQT